MNVTIEALWFMRNPGERPTRLKPPDTQITCYVLTVVYGKKNVIIFLLNIFHPSVSRVRSKWASPYVPGLEPEP